MRGLDSPIADLTNISQLDVQFDFFNGLYFLLAMFSSLAMVLYGWQTGNFQVRTAGVTIGIFILMAVAILRESILTSPASAFQASLAYWGTRLAVLIPGALGNLKLQFYSTASDSYFSTAMQDAPKWLKYYLNGHMAPYLENSAIFAEIVLIFGILEGTGGVNNIPFVNLPRPATVFIHFMVSVLIGGVTFSRIHGLRQPGFQLKAIVLMFIMAGALIGEDRGLFELSIFPVTFSATFGLHSGINILKAGGLGNYYITIGQAVEPFSYIIQATYILEGLTALVVIWGIGNWIYRQV